MSVFPLKICAKLCESPENSRFPWIFLFLTAFVLIAISLDFALYANSVDFAYFVVFFAVFSVILEFSSRKSKTLRVFPLKSLFSWLLLAIFSEITDFSEFPWIFLETYQILAIECEPYAKKAGFFVFPLQNLYFFLRFPGNDRQKSLAICCVLLSFAYFLVKMLSFCENARKAEEMQQEIAVCRKIKEILLREVREQSVLLVERRENPEFSRKPWVFLRKFSKYVKKKAEISEKHEKTPVFADLRVQEINEVAREEFGDNANSPNFLEDLLKNVEILKNEDENTIYFSNNFKEMRSFSHKSSLRAPPSLQKPGHFAEILRESFANPLKITRNPIKIPRVFAVFLRSSSQHATLRVFPVDSRTIALFLQKNCENSEKSASFLKETKENAENAQLREEILLKDKLLASVTHDMRSPLNGLVYFLRNARETCNESLKNQRIEYSLVNAQMLTFLVNDLLAFSQKNRPNSLNLSKFLLQNTVDSVCDCLKFEAESKGVRLFVENCCTKSLMLINDEFRLKQVLINLLTNALKFTLHGYVKVKLTQIKEIDDNLVKVEVCDTGLGIPKEVMPKLMQPYCTFDNQKVRVNKNGIGLGLFICKNIVKFLGPNDELFIYSEEEKGTKIGFLLYIVNELGEKQQSPGKSQVNSSKLARISEVSPRTEKLSKKSERVSEKSERISRNSEKISSKWENISGKSEKISMKSENVFAKTIESYHEENFLESECRDQVIKRRNISDKSFYNRSIVSYRSTASYNGTFNSRKSKLKRINAQISSFKMISSPRTFTTFRYSRSFNVLIVDDSAFNLLILHEILTGFLEWSFIIDKASNGKMALELFCEKNTPNSNELDAYHLIFMDCEMPFMDGVEATRLIRDKICKEGFRDVKIVGCTGDYEKFKSENKSNGLILGMDEWHGKPITKEIIGNCLRKFLA